MAARDQAVGDEEEPGDVPGADLEVRPRAVGPEAAQPRGTRDVAERAVAAEAAEHRVRGVVVRDADHRAQPAGEVAGTGRRSPTRRSAATSSSAFETLAEG